MDFYAINVAPINGWQTALGSGAASMAMSGTALGGLMLLGSGSAVQRITASGNGYAVIYGLGQASQRLIAVGDGKLIPFMGGTARMSINAVGNGVVAPLNASTAALRLLAADSSMNSIAVVGWGVSDMALSAEYGIPKNKPRSGSVDNKRDRKMTIQEDERALVVLADVDMRLRRPEPLRVARERN